MNRKLNILVAVNLHEKPEMIIEKAEFVAGKVDANFYLMHVIEDIPRISFYSDAYALWEEFREQALKETKSGLKKFAKAFSAKFGEVETIVEVGIVSDKLIEKAEEIKADLIIAGTHSKGTLEHMIHSNVAEKLVRRAKCSVLTFHIDTK